MFRQTRQCLEMLSPRDRLGWALLIPIVVVCAGVEAIAALTVFSLIRVVTAPSDPDSIGPFGFVRTWLEGSDDGTRVAVFATLAAVVYLVRLAVLAGTAHVQAMLLGRASASIAERLFERYLQAPLSFHLRSNSPTLIQRLVWSPEIIASSVLTPAVLVSGEFLVLAGLLCVLVVKAPAVSLGMTFGLAVIALALLKATHRKSTAGGGQEKDLRKKSLKEAGQGLRAIKELKVYGREDYFLKEFARVQGNLAKVRVRIFMMTSMMRLVVETAAVAVVLTTVAFSAYQAQNATDTLPLLALYAFAGLRTVPAANRILLGLSGMRQVSSIVADVASDFDNLRPPQPRVSNQPKRRLSDGVLFDDVSFSYAPGEDPVVDRVTLSIRRGDSLGIVGQTGSGKSTLIDILLGLLKPTHGRLLVDGEDVAGDPRAWQSRVGYVPQDPCLLDDTVRRNVAFGLPDEAIDDARVMACLTAARADELVGSMSDGLDTQVGERAVRLSGGQRQCLAIARALYHDPDLLVFDEATSSLDSVTERDVVRAIEELRGTSTLVVIAHRLSAVRSCDRIIVMRDGSIVGEGTFSELAEENAEFRELASAAAGEP